MEHIIETLRTRITQVADLRDAQGIRANHRTIVARLDEVEEYALANTFREFMTKIQRLESMLVSNGGGAIGEAIRVCTRRIDQQQALLDDVRNRMHTQDERWDWSDENVENVSGRENRTMNRRSSPTSPPRNPTPRPPPPPQTSEPTELDSAQQATQRLFVAYNQCVSRISHVEDRLEQFRIAATDLALIVHRHDQSVNEHCREIRQLTESVEEAQERIMGLDTYSQKIIQHEHHVNQKFDQNTHSQVASITAPHQRTGRSKEDGRRAG